MIPLHWNPCTDETKQSGLVVHMLTPSAFCFASENWPPIGLLFSLPLLCPETLLYVHISERRTEEEDFYINEDMGSVCAVSDGGFPHN